MDTRYKNCWCWDRTNPSPSINNMVRVGHVCVQHCLKLGQSTPLIRSRAREKKNSLWLSTSTWPCPPDGAALPNLDHDNQSIGYQGPHEKRTIIYIAEIKNDEGYILVDLNVKDLIDPNYICIGTYESHKPQESLGQESPGHQMRVLNPSSSCQSTVTTTKCEKTINHIFPRSFKNTAISSSSCVLMVSPRPPFMKANP